MRISWPNFPHWTYANHFEMEVTLSLQLKHVDSEFILFPLVTWILICSVIYQRITLITRSKFFSQSIFFSNFEQKVESILLKSFHMQNIRAWISLCHLTHEVIMIYKEWISHKTKTIFYWRKGVPKYLFLILIIKPIQDTDYKTK